MRLMTIIDEKFTREGSVSNSSFDPKNRTIEVIWAAGAPVKRYSWDTGFFIEELVMDKKSIRMERFDNGSMSLLDTHESYRMEDRLGVVLKDSVRISGGKGYATVKISRNPRGDALLNDLEDGIPFPVSVGYRIHAYEETEGADDGTLPKRRIIDWEPLELSAVPIPADAGAHSRSVNLHQGTKKMPNTIAIESPPIETADEDLARASYLDFIERKDVVPGRLIARMRAEGGDVVSARKQVLDYLDRQDSQISTFHTGGDHRSAGDDATARVVDALVVRMGGKSELADNTLVSKSSLDIARHYIQSRGGDTRSISDRSIANAMIGGREPWLQSRTLSTGDFPSLLANVASKVLLQRFEASPSTLKLLSRERSAQDFKPQSLLRVGEAPKLTLVDENGEVTHGKLSEEKNALQLATYAKILNLTLQAIINDDLGGFGDLIANFADAANVTEGDLFYDSLSRHAAGTINLADGTPGFHASRGNKAAAGAALSITTLSAARQAMRTQKSVAADRTAGVVPSVLLVGPALETVGEQLVATLNASQVSDQNPFAGKLRLMVEDRLAGNGWFVFGDPQQRPVFAHSYLDGQTGPQVTTRDGWEVLGTQFRCLLHFGAGFVDWRASYYNPGA
jgi:Mu-like prophage major head subunit gpT